VGLRKVQPQSERWKGAEDTFSRVLSSHRLQGRSEVWPCRP